MIDLNKLIAELELFSCTLKKQRYRTGKKLKMIGEETNISLPTIGGWENGKSFPNYEKLGLIAKAYELDEADLVNAYNISKQARDKEKSMSKFGKNNPPRDNSLSKLQEIIPPVVFQG